MLYGIAGYGKDYLDMRLKLAPLVRVLGGTLMDDSSVITQYEPLVKQVKNLIHKKQYQVLKAMNAETINLYWEIGEEICRQQNEHGWGNPL